MNRRAVLLLLTLGPLFGSSCDRVRTASNQDVPPEPRNQVEPVEEVDSAAATIIDYSPPHCWSISPLHSLAQRPALEFNQPYGGKVFVTLYPDSARQRVARWHLRSTRLSYKRSGEAFSHAHFPDEKKPLPRELQPLLPQLDKYLKRLQLRVVRHQHADCLDPVSFTIPIRVR
ncbi:hypothetical protein [Hymenobacter sp. B81]|uniref:hypothetical protein n=1 Tax=Hymenobacter sp. B81 TaxID=3344878 RepID=UPI0037DC3232